MLGVGGIVGESLTPVAAEMSALFVPKTRLTGPMPVLCAMRRLSAPVFVLPVAPTSETPVVTVGRLAPLQQQPTNMSPYTSVSDIDNDATLVPFARSELFETPMELALT